ncbi:MAG: hypothetical protein JXR38_02680, partial [Bacilli bacterium]|nr:hypothetical protein [Bacilli bacterium]
TGILVLFFFILKIDPDVITISIVFVMLVLYFFFKDYIIFRQARKAIAKQYGFVSGKHHNLHLYIPIMGRNGWMIFLKRAALYIVGDEMYLEAFDQQAFKSEPHNSISLRLGEDFRIISIIIDKKKPYYHVEALIKEQEYSFILPEHDSVIDFIQNKIQPKEEEVE